VLDAALEGVRRDLDGAGVSYLFAWSPSWELTPGRILGSLTRTLWVAVTPWEASAASI
jgi:hypothetical protein